MHLLNAIGCSALLTIFQNFDKSCLKCITVHGASQSMRHYSPCGFTVVHKTRHKTYKI